MDQIKKLWREWVAAEARLHELRAKASTDKDAWPMKALDEAKAEAQAAYDAVNAELMK